MWAVLAALATVAGLVRLAATRPDRVANRERGRLASLKSKLDQELDLDEAEDGSVLARRYGDGAQEARFRRIAETLKRGGRRA